jgi:uncharacterized membrane protein YphA (DoxX/SURF4 family)
MAQLPPFLFSASPFDVRCAFTILTSTNVSDSNHVLLPTVSAVHELTAIHSEEAGKTMNTVLWIVQLIMAGVFIFTGASKVLAYDQLRKVVEARSKGKPIGMQLGLAAQVGLLEIVGAIGLILPMDLFPPHLVVLSAAACLALLMIFGIIYHIRRQEAATPDVVLFLMALLVIVGRWPHSPVSGLMQ